MRSHERLGRRVKTVFSRSQRRPGDARSRTDSIDGLLYQGVASFRRRVIAAATVAVLLLAGISVALAWRQYEDARTRALNDLQARVVGVSAIVDTSFGGQIATLTSISKSPSVVNQESALMSAYFARVNPRGSAQFSGGLGWIDLKGTVLASSTPGGGSDEPLEASLLPAGARDRQAVHQCGADRQTPQAADRRGRRPDP